MTSATTTRRRRPRVPADPGTRRRNARTRLAAVTDNVHDGHMVSVPVAQLEAVLRSLDVSDQLVDAVAKRLHEADAVLEAHGLAR